MSATRCPITSLRGYRGVGTSRSQGISDTCPPVGRQLPSTTPYVVHQSRRIVVNLFVDSDEYPCLSRPACCTTNSCGWNNVRTSSRGCGYDGASADLIASPYDNGREHVRYEVRLGLSAPRKANLSSLDVSSSVGLLLHSGLGVRRCRSRCRRSRFLVLAEMTTRTGALKVCGEAYSGLIADCGA